MLARPDGASTLPADLRRERFRASRRAGVAVLAASCFTRPSGGELISLHQLMSQSDTVDGAFLRTSPDHGRTWSETVEGPTLGGRAENSGARGAGASPIRARGGWCGFKSKGCGRRAIRWRACDNGL